MSYDFVLMTPEAAGRDDATAVERALDRSEPDTGAPEPRIAAALAELTGLLEGRADDDLWVSMWPLDPGADALFVPVPYPEADDALLRLLRVAARHGLVLVDLSSDRVDRPVDGLPVAVKGGDGTRLGALSREHLHGLVDALGGADPWLVLERDDADFAQTYRDSADRFQVEYRAGSAERHFAAVASGVEQTVDVLWGWLSDTDGWRDELSWAKVDY